MRKLLPLFIALAISLFFIWNYAGLKTDFAVHQGGYHYQNMVKGGGAPSPYCYRMLVPFLSFGSTNIAYFWMMIGLTFSSWGLYLLTKQLGGNDIAAWCAMLLFLLWPDVSFITVFWFSVADPFAYAGLIFAAYFSLRKQWWPAVLAITIGVLSREVVLLALPFLFIIAPKREWKSLLPLALLPILVWLLIIGIISSLPAVIQGEDTLNILDRFWAVRAIRSGGHIESWGWLWKSFVVIGPLWLFGYQFLKDKRVLWFMTACGLIFISGDTVRMILYAVPAIIPIAALGLTNLVPSRWQLLVIGIVIAANSLRFT
jgi:hypothetical protein